jgi:hypothetical protein
MNAFAGSCVLIVDGRRVDHCTCALENNSGNNRRRYGFLSAPPEVLRAAKTAELVEMKVTEQPAQAISILHVTDMGLALISFASTPTIKVKLWSEQARHIVVGESLRDVCVKAESYLWNTCRAESPLVMEVAGGAPGSADHVREYLAALWAQISFERQSGGAGDQPTGNLPIALRRAKRSGDASSVSRPRQTNSANAEQLERIDRHIHGAQIRIEKQRTTIANLAVGGALRELAEKVLLNMSESLRLMRHHREVVSRPCISEI